MRVKLGKTQSQPVSALTSQLPANVSRSLKASALILSLVCVTSCATAPGSCKQLPLPEYTRDFTDGFVEQTATVAEGTPLARFILDARQLRADVRACQGRR